MNRPVGFSTGALAKGEYRLGLGVLRDAGIGIVELSALRAWELEPLADGVEKEELSDFSFIAVHAPSRYEMDSEERVVALLQKLTGYGWPVVAHPDAIYDFSLWQSFGEMLFIENMDIRKSRGRTCEELARIFDFLPNASFCFDAGHARQVDPTMCEARRMLKQFSDRIRQLHVSEVNSVSRHERLSVASIYAFQRIADLVPDNVPLILETPVPAADVLAQIESARRAFPVQSEARKVSVA